MTSTANLTGGVTRGLRPSRLEGGTEFFLQSDQGATEKELNSPRARPIRAIRATDAGTGFGFPPYAPFCSDYVVGPRFTSWSRPRSPPSPVRKGRAPYLVPRFTTMGL